MNYEELVRLTQLLQKYNEELGSIFEVVKQKGEPEDFFTIVKPFADKVREEIEQWEPLVLKWINQEKPKYFYKQQVENLKENITTVSVQAFFPKTGAKRFKELVRSNQYNLDSILKRINM
jgi:two-component SAPR family response regulator